MPRINIPKANFIELDIFSQKVAIRYRIISDNRNNKSYWSPIYYLDPGIDFIPNYYNNSASPVIQLLIEKHTSYDLIAWKPVDMQKNATSIGTLTNYDIWIRWGTQEAEGTWQYVERTAATSLNLVRPLDPAGLDHLSVEIYRPGIQIPQIRAKKNDIYQSNAHINTTTDTLTFHYNHEFETGTNVTYTAETPIPGLTNNTEYYVRSVSATQMTLHPTETDAINNTNKINLTGITNSIGFFTLTACPACDFLVYSEYNFDPA